VFKIKIVAGDIKKNSVKKGGICDFETEKGFKIKIVAGDI